MNFSENIPTRNLRVRGIADPGTIIRVYVNDILCKEGPATDNNLFEFETSVKFHGAVPIKITVLQGKITLGDTVATYPAIINKTTNGYFAFKIPMEDLLANVTETEITTYKNYTVTLHEGESFSCHHLLVNGPFFWEIGIHCKHLYEGMTVFTDNVDVPTPLFDTLYANFTYEQFENHHLKNAIGKLIQQLLSPQNESVSGSGHI